MAKKLDKTKTKNYLKSKGHNSAKVDSKKWNTETDTLQSLLELHGVTLTEYKTATLQK